MDRRSDTPLAYLITIRSYGTWLHGDTRGSHDRHRNAYRSPRIPSSRAWERATRAALRHPPVRLDAARREAVDTAIRETCLARNWGLLAVNVRTNHAHAVVIAACDPIRIITALKAYATRTMRERGCWTLDRTPWAAGGSRRYLWTTASVERAITYVVDGQGSPLLD